MGTNEVSRRRDEMPAREEGEGKGGKGGGILPWELEQIKIKIKFI